MIKAYSNPRRVQQTLAKIRKGLPLTPKERRERKKQGRSTNPPYPTQEELAIRFDVSKQIIQCWELKSPSFDYPVARKYLTLANRHNLIELAEQFRGEIWATLKQSGLAADLGLKTEDAEAAQAAERYRTQIEQVKLVLEYGDQLTREALIKNLEAYSMPLTSKKRQKRNK